MCDIKVPSKVFVKAYTIRLQLNSVLCIFHYLCFQLLVAVVCLKRAVCFLIVADVVNGSVVVAVILRNGFCGFWLLCLL